MASPLPKRLESADFKTFPNASYNVEAVKFLEDYAKSPQDSVLLIGSVGTGKTGLAVATLKAYEEIVDKDEYENDKYRKGTYYVVPDLLDEIRSSYDKDYDRVPDIKKAEFLVLDDLGAERRNDWVAEKLFQIINYRYDQMKPTIITTNLTLEELEEAFGERVVSRLIGMCKVFQIKGQDLRKAMKK